MDRAVFFKHMRGGLLGPTLSADEVQGTEEVLDACEGWPVSWTAYALATTYHETNATMLPVEEAYWLSEGWRKRNLRYYPWHGRGYVQLTWRYNYVKADQKLGLKGELLKTPAIAMQPSIAARIMRFGMEEGWFAGDKKGRHKLSRHLPTERGTFEQFVAARRIINGVDDNRLIARIAMRFQEALVDAGWGKNEG